MISYKVQFKIYIKKLIKTVIPHCIIQYIKKLLTRKKFFFQVQLADHCNLNCIGCSHFSPVADEYFLDTNDYENDCKRFSQLVKKHVSRIDLMGGEPLLHAGINKIIEITRNNFPNTAIDIFTNGILLKQMNTTFWKTCNQNNITIVLTQYPISIDLKKIHELCSEYNVKFITTSSDSLSFFRKDIYDHNGLQNNDKSFNNCLKRECHHLYNGKFYLCPSPPYIKYLNKYFGMNFNVKSDDYIDIYKVKNIRPFLKYIKNPIPFCRYCRNENFTKIKWELSKRDISEWTLI